MVAKFTTQIALGTLPATKPCMTQASFARLLLLLAMAMVVVALVRAPAPGAKPAFALSLTTPHISLSVSL